MPAGGARENAGRKTKKNENRVMYLGNLCIDKAIKIIESSLFNNPELDKILTSQQTEIMLKVIPRMFPQTPLIDQSQHTHYISVINQLHSLSNGRQRKKDNGRINPERSDRLVA